MSTTKRPATMSPKEQAWKRLRQRGLSQDAGNAAIAELSRLFDLFGDADVLDMLEMKEPSDAALAAITPRNIGFAIADQRIERWFVPFWRVAPTGYLRPDGMTARP